MAELDDNIEATQTRLQQWLATKLPDAQALTLENLKRPEGSGFSNDTLLADLAYRENGQQQNKRIVFRISPIGFPVFPFYDIPQQFDVMSALASHTTIPVPNCLWKEYDKSIVGETFYVMEFLEGKVPADNPPYHMTGFVKDASPADRGTMWNNSIKAMAELHKLDYREAGLGFLAWPDQKKSAIEQHLEYYADYFHWAARGKPQPVAEYTLQWLQDNMPSGERDGII